jgi:hypothetical protein
MSPHTGELADILTVAADVFDILERRAVIEAAIDLLDGGDGDPGLEPNGGDKPDASDTTQTCDADGDPSWWRRHASIFSGGIPAP